MRGNFGIYLRSHWLTQSHNNFSPTFSYRSFRALGLTSESTIYFKFIFVYGVWFRQRFPFFLWEKTAYYSNTIIERTTISPTNLPLYSCQNSVNHKCKSLFMHAKFCSIDLCFSYANTTVLVDIPYSEYWHWVG